MTSAPLTRQQILDEIEALSRKHLQVGAEEAMLMLVLGELEGTPIGAVLKAQLRLLEPFIVDQE